MSGQVVLDASVLIAALQPRDAHHAQARNLLRLGARGTTFIAHSLTLAESGVGAARNGHLAELRMQYRVLGIQLARADDEEPWRLAKLRASTRLPIPDCCVLDLAESTGSHLATFDEHLAGVARSRNVTVAATGTPA